MSPTFSSTHRMRDFLLQSMYSLLRRHTLFLAVILFSPVLPGQELNNTGEILQLQVDSKYLDTERTLEVYLPPGYKEEQQKRYPVMYILDGQNYFLHPVAYQRMLHFKDKCPEFIVVGIDTDRKERREHLDGDSRLFANFLKEELIPKIYRDFRTLGPKERIYFGWELGASLGIQILGNNRELFSAFFLASPSHFTPARLEVLGNTIHMDGIQAPFLYLTIAQEENHLEDAIHQIDLVYRSMGNNKPLFKTDIFPSEDHYSTPLKTINNGLKAYFSDYNTLRFHTLEAYDSFGDLKAIKAYYHQRGKRYGIPGEVHRTTQHFLLFNGMIEDNFERFEGYAEEFDAYLKNPILEIWPIRFGGYFAEKNEMEKTLDILHAGLIKFPKSSRIPYQLGKLYFKLNERNKAKYHYELAIDLGEKNKDDELQTYKNALAKPSKG